MQDLFIVKVWASNTGPTSSEWHLAAPTPDTQLMFRKLTVSCKQKNSCSGAWWALSSHAVNFCGFYRAQWLVTNGIWMIGEAAHLQLTVKALQVRSAFLWRFSCSRLTRIRPALNHTNLDIVTVLSGAQPRSYLISTSTYSVRCRYPVTNVLRLLIKTENG